MFYMFFWGVNYIDCASLLAERAVSGSLRVYELLREVLVYVFLDSLLLLGDLAPNLANRGLLIAARLFSIRLCVDYLGEFI